MTYTNVTYESYGSRIKSSIAYAFFGLFLFIGSFFYLAGMKVEQLKPQLILTMLKKIT